MRRFSYLLEQSPVLRVFYDKFMQMKQLTAALTESPVSMRNYQINAVAPLFSRLASHVGVIQNQFLMLCTPHIMLDTVLAQHLQRVHVVSLEAQDKLKCERATFAADIQTLQRIDGLAVELLASCESGGWCELDVSRASLLGSQRAKRVEETRNKALRTQKMRSTDFYADYLRECDVSAQATQKLATEARNAQNQVDYILHQNPSISGQNAVKNALLAKITQDQDKNAELQHALAKTVLFRSKAPRVFEFQHDFADLARIMAFEPQALPDFSDLYVLLETICSAMRFKKYQAAVVKLYRHALRVFTDFHRMRLLSDGFGFAFESSERFALKFGKVLFSLGQANTKFAKYLNTYVTHQYKLAYDRYNSFQLTGIHRAGLFDTLLFDGDDLNQNDVGCVIFYVISQLVLSGFRAQLGGSWNVLPEMLLSE